MMDERGEIVIYPTEDGLAKLDVKMRGETVWLSLDQMALLFGRDKSTISRHIRNVFAEGKLSEAATVANFATVATDGKTYQIYQRLFRQSKRHILIVSRPWQRQSRSKGEWECLTKRARLSYQLLGDLENNEI